MKLFSNPFSSNHRRVALVIVELGVEVEQVFVDMSKGAHKAPEFLAINPNGQVPAFTDGDLTLFESNAIATYLCDVARAQGNPAAERLWPSAPKARAEVMKWVCWQLAKLDSSAGPIGYEGFVKPVFMKAEPDAARLARGVEQFRKHAAILEAALEGKRWLAGEGPTLADYGLAVCLQTWPMAPYPLEDFPNVKAWTERVRALPAWAATEPRFGG